jgi:hypothetical protein
LDFFLLLPILKKWKKFAEYFSPKFSQIFWFKLGKFLGKKFSQMEYTFKTMCRERLFYFFTSCSLVTFFGDFESYLNKAIKFPSMILFQFCDVASLGHCPKKKKLCHKFTIL